jgi:hypothetical protein
MSERNNNEPLALGTEFPIYFDALSRNEAGYTVEQLITALEATTTLTDLRVDFINFDPKAENNHCIVAQLCRCIANLRLPNERHPLKKIKFCRFDWNDGQEGMYLDVFEQFLIAAKRFGVSHLTFQTVMSPLPIQFLLEFCRDNSLLRVLALNHVYVSGSNDVQSWPLNDRLQGASVNLNLDKLLLRDVSFTSSAAAASFGNFMAHLSVRVVELGLLYCSSDDIECNRIISEFKIPSVVEQLTLGACGDFDYYKATLKAATTTVTDLTVLTYCADDRYVSSRNKELENLTCLIRGTAKLLARATDTAESDDQSHRRVCHHHAVFSDPRDKT